MKFLSDILAKAGLTVDGVVTLNNTATGQTPASNDNSTKLATTAWVRTFVQPYSLPIASTSILGGIKVGSGLSIDAGTGVLSAVAGGSASIKSTQTFTATAGQTVFTISGGYTVGLIDVFLNGVYLSPNQTTATNGTTITLGDAAAAGDIIDVIIASPVYQGATTTTDQLSEGTTNLYFTNARARAAISETVTGLDYNSSTGVLSITTGYGIPTTASQTTWDAAYNDKINSAAVTGTTTKTLTLTQQDGGTITASWTDINTDAVTSVFGRTGVVVAVSGDYTTTLVTEGTNLYYTDARARAAISVTGSGSYNSATGVITVTGGVTSVNTLTGAVVLTTTNIAEGTNLYYTQARFDTAFTAKSTTNLTEGTNLYYTSARANADFDTRLATKSTSNLSEGTNLYYTDARVGTYLTANSYATQTYVGTQIANLVAAAPATLDTLNELAAALGNDPSFATTVSTSIGTKVPQTRTITINGTTFDLSANRTYTINSMVYPGAGIALSTGSAWGTSITDNSANWNTAFGWGNHASGGYLTTALAATTYASLTGAYTNPAFVASLAYSKITGVPAFITSYTEVDTLATVTGRGSTTTAVITVTASEGREVAVYMPSSYTTDDLVSGHEYGWYSDHWRLGMTRSGGVAGGDFVIQWNAARRLSLTSGGNLSVTGTIGATNFSGTHSGSSSGTNTGDQTLSGLGGVPTSGYSFGTSFTLGTMYVGTGAQATVTSLLGVYSNGYTYTFGAAAVQSFLGLGSLAYSSATIPTNNNQLTNGAGYITGISSGNVTTALGYTPWNYGGVDASRNIGVSTNLDTDLESGGAYGSYGAGGTSWNAPFSYGAVLAFAFTSGIKAQFGFDIRHNQSDYGDLRYRTKNNLGYSTWRTMWHSGNLTNLNQLSNGPGYITGYSETDTLATVTNRGNTASTAINTTVGANAWAFNGNTSGYSNASGIWFTNNVGELLLRNAAGSLITRIAADGSYAFINSSQIILASNISSYAVTSLTDTLATVTARGGSTTAGITVNGRVTASGGGTYAVTGSSTQRYIIQALNTSNSVNSSYGWWWFHNTNGDMGFHADGIGDILNLTRGGGFTINGNTVLTAGNYTSYSPSLTGGGASGNWGINITGNAATVGSLSASSFVRNDTTGQYLRAYYQYGSYLTTESPLDLVNQGLSGGGLRVDFMGSSYAGGGSWNHVITWSGYNGYNMYQLGGYYDGGSTTNLYVRSEANHGRTSWTSWRRLLNETADPYAVNMNQYVRTSDAPTFNGVTSTGTLYLNGGSYYGTLMIGSSSYWRCGISQRDAGNAEMRIWAKGGGAGSIYFATGYDGESSATTLPTDGMALKNNNLGLGSWGVSEFPSYKLHVKGTAYATSDMRAPIFYDSNDTAYYVDPNGQSVLSTVRTAIKAATGLAGYGGGSWVTDFSNTPVSSMTFGEDKSSGGPSGTWWFQLNMRHQNSSNLWGTQLAFGWEDNANRLLQRNVTGGNWSSWVEYINSNNIGSQSVSYASTAGSANSVSWSNVSGRPSSLSQFSNDSGYITSSGNAASSNVATYARRIDGVSRVQFTVGGSSGTFYPVALNVGAGSTSQQYAEFVIERGGYDDPGYSGIGFSTFNARFSYKPSGWGYGAVNVSLEMLGQTTTMLADYADYYQGAQFIVWLRGATTYWAWSVVGGVSVIFENSSGTSYNAGYTTYGTTTTVAPKATTNRNFYGSLRVDDTIYAGGSIVSGNNIELGGSASGNVVLTTYNNRNLRLTGTGGSDVGICGRRSGGSFGFQLYGEGTAYGFLNYEWGAWNLKKVISGALYMNDNNSYYINTTGDSSFSGALSLGGGLTVAGTSTLNGQVYINRHIDANTTWGSCGCNTIFVGWSTSKVVIGNGNSGGHDYANGLGSNSVVSTNPFYCYQDITAYSDSRVKENVEVVDNAVEKIKAIRGVTFTRNDVEDKTKRHAGVIAQEVLAVLPEAVSEDLNGHYSVAYGNLNALLIEAIKEQQTQIESQKSEIDVLKDLVQQLINR